MDLIFPGLYPCCENANHNVLDELSLPGKFQNISFFGGEINVPGTVSGKSLLENLGVSQCLLFSCNPD